MTGACEDESGRGGKGQGCGSWSHRLLRGKAADADEVAGGAARADPRLRGSWRLGRPIGGVFSRPGLMRRGRALEQEQQTGSSCEIALGGVPQAEVADLVQALGRTCCRKRRMNSWPGIRLVRQRFDFAVLVADGDGRRRRRRRCGVLVMAMRKT